MSQNIFQPATVVNRIPDATNVVSLFLRNADGSPMPPFLPGQYIRVRSCGIECVYTLSSGPTDLQHYRITVKRTRVCNGCGCSGHWHDTVKVGDIVEISRPAGDFVLRREATPIVMITAGVGVTPIISMMHALSDWQDNRSVFVFYGARNGKEHVLREELWETARTTRARMMIAYTQPSAEDRLGTDFHFFGRLTPELVLSQLPNRQFQFYICGPDAFLSDFRTGLASAGVMDQTIRQERFGPRSSSVEPSQSSGVTVGFARSGIVATWEGKHKNLLTMAESLGLRPSYGCRVGFCHACAVGLLGGRIRYTAEGIDDPGNGRVLICCSEPETDIRLDM